MHQKFQTFLNHLLAVVLIGLSVCYTENAPEVRFTKIHPALPSYPVIEIPHENKYYILDELRKTKPEVYQYIMDCNLINGRLDYSIHKDNIHLFFYGSGGSQHMMFDSQNRLLLHIENLARKDIPGDLEKELEVLPFRGDIVFLKKMTTQQKSWYEVIVKNGTDIKLYKWIKGNWITG
jgi:hypothetical protein